ncbi:MAG: hypothetical protein M3N52_09180 [Actinomycetota bacterium]|nr:hypothetical protein [Actinomycetota bacterium]
MSLFVVLSVAGLVIALGVAFVAALRLRSAVAALVRRARANADRVTPLTEELRAEGAVAEVELGQLQARLEALRRRDERGGARTAQ